MRIYMYKYKDVWFETKISISFWIFNQFDAQKCDV